ncbi:MAG TPA: ABC transporter substrate-binding protein [Natronosporangium sp.]|nr:ABC transporter substrate-binding protein [Natronosporangium sp.]
MRRRTLLAAALTVGFLITGCTSTTDEATSPTPGTQEGFPVTVGDLTLEAQPTRIVSLSPTVTEMLFAIGAGEQVVAVDEQSNYPPEAPVTDLSGFNLNVDALVTYDPDLVVISSFAGDLVPQLETLDIPVYVAPDNPTSMDDVYAQITELGALTGRVEEAEALVAQMESELTALFDRAPKREEPLTYFIEIDESLWTYTADSLISVLFAEVGLENIVDEPGSISVQLSAEVLFEADPDIIFLIDTRYGVDAESVAARDGWDALQAVRNGQIIELDTDMASRWGPRLVDLMADVVDVVSQVA